MVAALFVRRGSPYYRLGCDCYDIQRDARTFAGPGPVVAHPPCRAWGRLRHLAKPREGERELAFLAVDFVRRFGGVLEHPQASRLFCEARLPLPGGLPDEFGGFSVEVDQVHWGHRARKRTWLYLVGCAPLDLSPPPFVQARPTTTVERMCRAEREATPFAFASWLVHVAAKARPPGTELHQ